MAQTLKDKVALITAGSRGIGGAIATRLAEDGANVAITFAGNEQAAHDKVSSLKALGVEAHAFRRDASKPDDHVGLIEEVVSRFGRIDILVNNSGTFTMGPVGAYDGETIDRILDWNVKTPIVLANEAAGHLQEGGRIINIGSVNGDTAPQPGLGLYGMSKAALQGLTRGWARDLAERKITVNIVQPGPVDTEMNPADSDFADVLRSFTPLARYGQPEEVANLVGFLASPQADYITGAQLTIDGGMTT
jgi:3-oxoacyl-[acyl-carrier protein] reductase